MWSFKRAVDHISSGYPFLAALFLLITFLSAVFFITTILIILFETFGLYALLIFPLYSISYLIWAGWERTDGGNTNHG